VTSYISSPPTSSNISMPGFQELFDPDWKLKT
jgi:hypothetical protein